MEQKTFFIKTYGCQMNVHESEKIAALLALDGFVRIEDESNADIIIFNTCTVRNTAESKIISHLAVLHREKLEGRNLIIGMVGCLSQRDGIAKQLQVKFPKLDIILGTHNIGIISQVIKHVQNKKQRVIQIQDNRTEMPQFDSLVPSGDRQKPNTHYINVTYGCENYCTYCIVPYVRGKLISRPSSEIFSEFETLVKTLDQPNLATEQNSSHIIYLLGQNVNSYLCPQTNINFVQLLTVLCDKLAEIASLQDNNLLVNFMSSHPKDFSLELAHLIATRKEIEPNIHLPLQNGSNKILAQMNRGYSIEQYIEKIDNLRKIFNKHNQESDPHKSVRQLRLTTDIICGFPGETEDDFAQTIKAMQTIKFNSAFIFPYSRRSGTIADKMPNQLDHATKKRRTTELLRIQKDLK
ncbi:MAG: MiaB/RimO family radical SAM methylthiotransferase [Firmicutes bacterium]|nr:MiaB/RimO family radical SAM methylthiotransferase [Bacillota bacterium]